MDSLKSLIKLIDKADNQIALAEREIIRFQERLSNDPVGAMVWCDHMWTATWKKVIWEEIKLVLEGDSAVDNLPQLKDSYERALLQIVRFPCRSTSVGSRQSHIAKGEVLGELVQDWRFIFEH
jgi:hypothetical protein